MASLNQWTGIGRLCADPEYKTPSGIAVANFRIAIDRPQGKEARDAGAAKRTDFINIVCWRQIAEFVHNYITKGRLVCVVGALNIREYTDQNTGTKRKIAEIMASSVIGLDRAPDTDNDGHRHTEGSPTATRGNTQPTTGANGERFDEEIDDPFADN